MFRFPRRNKKDNGGEPSSSQEALADAQNSLRRIEKRSNEVTAYSNAVREINERNHFADALEKTFEAIIANGIDGGTLGHDPQC